MGRRPNLVLLQHFERGAKLNDNSNRYRYVCKACGEDFPKGRSETLVSHLTKKCPAITEAERVNACLALHGIGSANAQRAQKFDPTLIHSGPNAGPPPSSQPATISQSQNPIWTPLETLAEVSRQIEAHEKHDDHLPTTQEAASDLATTTSPGNSVPLVPSTNPFDVQDHLSFVQATLNSMEPDTKRQKTGTCSPDLHFSQNEEASWEQEHPANIPVLTFYLTDDAKAESASIPQHELTPEERLQNLLQSTEPAESASQSAVSVAAAATARLNPSLLDPQLLAGDVLSEAPTTGPSAEDVMIDFPPAEHEPTPVESSSQPSTTPVEPNLPWASMAFMPEDIHGPATVNDHGQQPLSGLNKGGFRMDTPNGPRHRHSRARFATERRKEVQEVRRIGACIRCRILRKTCSKGTPCDTCKKVLSPRVWRTGCVRTKLSEFIDLYTAGVQIVMSQKRVNGYKRSHLLTHTGMVVEAAHFPETGHKVEFEVLQGHPLQNTQAEDLPNVGAGPVVLLHNDKEDVPLKVENYMRQILPELIRREPSPYVRITLETATKIAGETNDELLKRSLELWGIVEIMDRERQWTMLAKSPDEGLEDYCIKDEADSEPYTNICMQLTAGAERKAAVASRNLLNGIQRNLQDGKMKLGFPMFLTVMLFLNCVEKTTWAFKAWDEENLRPKWPLEKQPSNYTNQGHGLCELLRMLLVIRHILPKTTYSEPDIPIRAEDEDPVIRQYFVDLNITPAYLRMRHEENNFQPTDSRSLEFLFCAPLLLT